MRLLRACTIQLEEFPPDKIPPYAILSHTWETEEVLIDDLRHNTAERKASWKKVKSACEASVNYGLEYVWIDSCCIDKSSSAELSETINSMYSWYRKAEICWTFLADVPTGVDPNKPGSEFERTRWLTRGFTLQELLAPREAVLFSREWVEIGKKTTLCSTLSRITRIDEDILMHRKPLEYASIARRMSWAAHRQTTRPEDMAYCLMGIFDVNMPMLYGEGKTKAFLRLQEEIMKQSDDQSIFAWVDPAASDTSLHGLLATSPANFASCYDILPYQDWESRQPYSMTNCGLQIGLPLTQTQEGIPVAVLDCPSPPHFRGFLGIFLKRLSQVDEQYARIKLSSLAEVQDRGPPHTIYVRQTSVVPETEGIFPHHVLQIRQIPDSSTPYRLVNIIDMNIAEKQTPQAILSTRDPDTGPIHPRFAKTFTISKAANTLCVCAIFDCYDETRLLVMLGSDAQFGVGFSVIERDQRDHEHDFDKIRQEEYKPKTPGTWIELKHHMVSVKAEPRVANSVKYFMVDIEVKEVGRPSDPIQLRQMEWFPVGRNNSSGWRLDVVSLIAILGESLMARHIQQLSATMLCLLPRILPAPQSFLRSARALRLPSPPAIVCGVYSGTLIHELNYFADIIHPITSINKYEVKVYNITWADQRKTYSPKNEALVPSCRTSPLNLLTVASFFLTLGAFIWAIVIKDGVAVLALIAMCSASTLIGIASYWRPQLAARPTDASVPDGDIVIRTRDGAFIIIQCTEEVARELYIGPEECNYLVNEEWFKVLVGVGTLLIILSVLLLGNCDWIMQAVIAVIYITLNALYWVASLCPQSWLWDLSRYNCIDVTPEHLRDAHTVSRGGVGPSYTRSLWYAIQATGQTEWVTLSGAAPRTIAWETWLKLAQANCGNQHWKAIAEKDRLMREARLKTGPRHSQRFYQQMQKAPATLPVRRETA
ncbi:uncharacterized protein CDV56_109645 [Aspergillus thermomutatus]|uniref:Uncharacterized protein n=1 Tax=Aspergillus thermomutatus TaxID=41047 RepID=A0A397I0S3_ASPTH|nr:uncharacterized protein CDV56_109645 [Aspergillus thermomutatus]RHZ67386.1 hypothetical protein CDV56_109645 [Aspergillus thermomutatus]